MSVLGALNTTSRIKAETVEETEILFVRPERAAALVREQPAWQSISSNSTRTGLKNCLMW
jgi:hypothetical protein